MSAESEMREVILHAAEKLKTARGLGDSGWNHGYELPALTYIAMAYAEGVLHLLASYLKVEKPAASNGQPALMPPRDQHGRFAKQEVER